MFDSKMSGTSDYHKGLSRTHRIIHDIVRINRESSLKMALWGKTEYT